MEPEFSSSRPSISFQGKLIESVFVNRPNRFLIRCLLPRENELEVEAHLADPGRLKELLIPGVKIWLLSAPEGKRRTRWSALLVETPDKKGLISLDTRMPNRLIGEALRQSAFEELADWTFERAEVTLGRSRIDFLLTQGNENNLALEVKSVTLVKRKVGLFPDATTTRGARHARELAQLVGQVNWSAAILFVVQREDVKCFRVARELDPKFALALDEARESGVKILARRCRIRLDRITLGGPIPIM